MYSTLRDSNGAISEGTCACRVDVWFCGELMQLTKADGMLGTGVMQSILGFVFGQREHSKSINKSRLRAIETSFHLTKSS